MFITPKFKSGDKVYVAYHKTAGDDYITVIGPVTVCLVTIHTVEKSDKTWEVTPIYKFNSLNAQYFEWAVASTGEEAAVAAQCRLDAEIAARTKV